MVNCNFLKQPQKRLAGQSLVEFALLLPVLVMLILGALDLGRAFFTSVTIANAAREGARFGISHPTDSAGMIAAAIDEAQNSGISLGNSAVATITVSCQDTVSPAGCDRAQPLRVSVTYQFRLILGWILPQTIPLQSTAVMFVP
jgi:Flp pilus assembly protein TadG